MCKKPFLLLIVTPLSWTGLEIIGYMVVGEDDQPVKV